jgi:hypothetical protein
MNTHNTVPNNASAEATTSDRILQTALAAWKQDNFVEVADQFNDQFTFTDYQFACKAYLLCRSA